MFTFLVYNEPELETLAIEDYQNYSDDALSAGFDNDDNEDDDKVFSDPELIGRMMKGQREQLKQPNS